MAHFLFDLPTDLAVDIVSSWLDVREAVRLDVAFCETSTRPKFAYILSNCRLRFPIHTYRYGRNDCDHVVSWSLKRDVRVDILNIREESDLRMYKEFLLKRGTTVSEVVYYQSDTSGEAGKDFISTMATYCPHLKSFDLIGHNEFNNGLGFALRAVLMNCTKLQDFSISAGGYTNPLSLQNICCPNLRSISFDYVFSAEVLAAFFKMTPNLQKLMLRVCNFELLNGENALQYISPTVDCVCAAELTDDDLIRIVDSCPRVTRISLSDPQYESAQLTVRSIEYMARRLKLTELDINYGRFSGACLQAVANHCSATLTSLEMMDFPSTPARINAVLRVCTKLTRFRSSETVLNFSLLSSIKELNLAVYQHDQSFLTNIAHHCKELVHLALYHLPGLETPEDLDNIVNSCPHLCSLELTRAVGLPRSKYIGEETIAAWKLIRPKLVVTECEYSTYP